MYLRRRCCGITYGTAYELPNKWVTREIVIAKKETMHLQSKRYNRSCTKAEGGKNRQFKNDEGGNRRAAQHQL